MKITLTNKWTCPSGHFEVTRTEILEQNDAPVEWKCHFSPPPTQPECGNCGRPLKHEVIVTVNKLWGERVIKYEPPTQPPTS